MDSKLKKLKGFTIIELLVVIVIISVLGAISVPAALTWIRDSKIKSANSNAQLVYSTAQDYLTQLEIKNVNLSTAGVDGYIYCAADNGYDLSEGGKSLTSSVRGAIHTPFTLVDFSSSLGDSFEGVWAVRFNPDTYTVRYAWWTENTADASLIGKDVLTTPYATYAAQESAYNSSGMLVGQFPIQ